MKGIQLTQGQISLVDEKDFEWLSQWKWYATCKRGIWYACRTEHRNMVFMHRLILKAPKGRDVDHKDRNGLNNQRYNIRICTKAQNQQNNKVRKNNTSGYKGVSMHRRKWMSRIRINGKRKHLGYFDTPQEAAHIYYKTAIESFGEFARLL